MDRATTAERVIALSELEARAENIWAARPVWARAIQRLRREYHEGGRMAEGAYRKILEVLINHAPAPTLFGHGKDAAWRPCCVITA